MQKKTILLKLIDFFVVALLKRARSGTRGQPDRQRDVTRQLGLTALRRGPHTGRHRQAQNQAHASRKERGQSEFAHDRRLLLQVRAHKLVL